MSEVEPAFWRVHCHIGDHPGQWQRWYREQCCAIGWPPMAWKGMSNPDGYTATDTGGHIDFSTSINHCRQMRPGDWILATLPRNRVGRLGRVFQVAIEDGDWNPVVLPNKRQPFGDNGRRIEVRWDLNVGPADPAKVVLLPKEAQFIGGLIRGTVRQLPIERLASIRGIMDDSRHWVSLASAFNLETALSAYIALHPHRLEEGLSLHSSFGSTEAQVADGGRIDVLLEDRRGNTVVVECKQGTATIDACEQVLRYRRQIEELVADRQKVRAMVVHGGGRRVSRDVVEFSVANQIDLVYFELTVNFVNSV